MSRAQTTEQVDKGLAQKSRHKGGCRRFPSSRSLPLAMFIVLLCNIYTALWFVVFSPAATRTCPLSAMRSRGLSRRSSVQKRAGYALLA